MKNFIVTLFFTSILFTILSQVPQFLDAKVSSYFQLSWLILLIFLLFTKNIFLSKSLSIIFILTLFTIVYSLLLESVTNEVYLHSPHYMNMLKSVFVLALSFYSAQFITESRFKSGLVFVSLVGGTILLFSVYKYSFANGFDITSRVYAYASKNSVSQIILSCMIIVIFLSNPRSRLAKVLNLTFLLVSIYVILILKSRATIFGLVFIAIALFIQTNDKKKKYTTLIFLSLTGVVLFLNDTLFNILYKNIILGSREGGLNDVSSGRVDFFLNFPSQFIEHVWFGHGYLFSESFPLSVLLDNGIIGSFTIFLFVLIPIIFYKKKLTASNPLHLSFLLLIVTFYFNGLFEQQAPLGPGSKNFMLWLLFGYLLQSELKHKKKENNKL